MRHLGQAPRTVKRARRAAFSDEAAGPKTCLVTIKKQLGAGHVPAKVSHEDE